MANVMFKRGLQSALPANGSAQDGVFYLTTDTNRLYVGMSDHSRVLLNQTVNFVDSLTTLQNMSASWDATQKQSHINDLYYITGSNVLAVWTNAVSPDNSSQVGWVQINPDDNTYVTETDIELTNSGNGVNVAFQIAQNEGAPIDDAEFLILGSQGVKTEVDSMTGALTITGDQWTLSRSVSGGAATVSLASAQDQAGSSVIISAGENITIASTTNGFSITSENDYVNQGSAELEDGKIKISLAGDGGAGADFETEQLTIKYGSTHASTAILGGNMDVYTTSEVDNLLKGLDGVTYSGTIGSSTGVYAFQGGALIKKSSGSAVELHNGDMFLISDSEVIVDGSLTAYKGDILIATGTETNGVLNSVEWTYIPSGDDSKQDTTVVPSVDSTNHSIEFTNSTADVGEGAFAGIDLDAGTGIVLSSDATAAGDGFLKTTISHANVNTNASSYASVQSDGDNIDYPDSISVVTGVSVDQQGHTFNVETTEVTLEQYSFTAETEDITNGVALSLDLNGLASDHTSENTIDITSTSLAISSASSGSAAVINLEWGTF